VYRGVEESSQVHTAAREVHNALIARPSDVQRYGLRCTAPPLPLVLPANSGSIFPAGSTSGLRARLGMGCQPECVADVIFVSKSARVLSACLTSESKFDKYM
jgi:hypothetical protein